ncbi:MAG: mannose-1-phosphate guanylyltransferase [Bacteroidota bacterium]
MTSSNYVVIMAGGIGSRFWPVSRTDYPKQFLDILGTGKTLIQQTYNRFTPLVPIENIYVITADDYTDIVKEQLPMLPAANILGEPCRKNTAPCIAYLSFKLQKKDPGAVLIVTPADHLILNETAFKEDCLKALDFVKNNDALLTLGITPTHPNTGYGYIQRDSEEQAPSIFKVNRFTEKPTLEKAKTFIASGDFLWNAGIFVWRATVVLESFKLHLPDIYYLFESCMDEYNTGDEKKVVDTAYAESQSISVDYAIMEKADNTYILPVTFEWSDLGTWTSAWENMEKDISGNAVSGDSVIVIDTSGCIIHAPSGKAIVVQGLSNFMVIDTEDALVICSKEKEQHIKEYSAIVGKELGAVYLHRPYQATSKDAEKELNIF